MKVSMSRNEIITRLPRLENNINSYNGNAANENCHILFASKFCYTLYFDKLA